MMKNLFFCFLLFSFIFCNWNIVQNHYETIAISTSFTSSTDGYVTGGTAKFHPLFLYTTDGGQNFTNQGLSDSEVGAFFSIRMASEKWGVAGGFGFFGTPCGAYTKDGKTWSSMGERGLSLACALQGCAVVDDDKTGVLIGAWSHSRDWNGNGIKITTDGGRKWKQINGDTGAAVCRYGSFLSKDMGYITSGIFPTTTSSNFEYNDNKLEKYHLSQYVKYDPIKQTYSVDTSPINQDNPIISGYSGLISAVTNEGNDWNVLVNITGQGFYFNEISCLDENNCWAVTEGVNATGSGIGSVYHTSNGWSTYDIQLNIAGGALSGIQMLNSTFGWTVGALVSGPSVQGDFDGQFWYTTDGMTWTLDSQIKNFFPMDVSVPDGTHAYAAGLTPVGVSSFAAYSA